jgi:hypothetical protein
MSFINKVTAQLPFGKKSETAEYYFALSIGLSQVTAGVWELFGNKIDIIGQATAAYRDTEDLLDKAYQALNRSLGALEIEPQKILFGVPDSWSLDDDLKEPYLKLLRRMLKEFDLEPMAYVTTTNAISFLLQKQEGVPPTSILIGVGDFVEITLYRGGKTVGTKTVDRSQQLFEDIEKALKQFTEVEVLPSKILVYATKAEINLNKIRDEMMSFPWMQRLSFLHFPKIETLEDNLGIKAVVLSAASELKSDIDFRNSFATQVVDAPLNKQSLDSEKEGLKEIDKEEDLGFVKGDIKDIGNSRPEADHPLDEEDQDISKSSPIKSGSANHLIDDSEQSNTLKNRSTDTPSDDTDISDTPTFRSSDNLVASDLSDLEDDKLASATDDDDLGVTVSHGKFNRSLTGLQDEASYLAQSAESEINGALVKAKSVLPPSVSGAFNRLPSFNIQGLGKLLIIPLILVIVAAAYIFFLKASVTIFVEPKVLEKTAEVTADPNTDKINEDQKIIPGSFVETTVSGSGKASATGKKQIGDPAKGKVVVYNLTSSSRTFSQGSTLSGPNGLKFTLDTSVQVASQSSSVGADFTTVIKPGKSDAVGVTAANIGPEGNLPADSELSVGNFAKSEVVARVEEALSGGTSKDVTVVTSDDQKKLKAQVLDDLRQKAETELQGKLQGDKKIISDALTVVDSKYTFNKQVNDQASEFSLSATIHFKGVAYSETDLRTIVAKLVSVNVPDGFTLDLASSETQAAPSEVGKDGKLIFQAKFKAKLLPKFNLDDLKKEIRGQSVAAVADKLQKIENVVGSEIKLTPNLPIALSRMPILIKNITVTVTPK